MSAERYGAYSVLMSVYSKENPAWLKLAIESIKSNCKFRFRCIADLYA